MPELLRTPVVQFGTSRFLQAHADAFIEEAAAAGQAAGPVTIVAASGSGGRRDRLRAFNDPAGYPVEIRGLQAGRRIERTLRVHCVRRGLDAAEDWAEVVRIVVEEAEFLISNMGEGGYAMAEGFRLDLPAAVAPPNFPGKLLAVLAARHAAGRPGLVVLPTELVGRNGDTLKRVVLDLARRSAAPADLIGWIETGCVFANSLVDRIVSTPLEPAGAVAEPYGLWAIEETPGLRLPCIHPAIQVVRDFEQVERLKIHILNLGHTVLAEKWHRDGLDPALIVRVMLSDPDTRTILTGLYAEEVLPGFAARGMGDAAAADVAPTLARFDNPFLEHRLSDIHGGHAAKVQRRIVAFMAWAGEAGAPPMPRLAAIAQRYQAETAQ